MKIKEKYDLKKVKQITIGTPIGDCCELHFEDGTKFTLYAGEFIQLLAWLESEAEGMSENKKEEYTEKQQGVLMAYDWIIEKLDAIFDFAESELGSGCEAIDNLVLGVGDALQEKVQLFLEADKNDIIMGFDDMNDIKTEGE